jgi:hypothetical protein
LLLLLLLQVLQVMLCVSDGEPIKLPENLEGLPKADHLPTQRHRWNTNEVSLQINHRFYFQTHVSVRTLPLQVISLLVCVSQTFWFSLF